MRFTVSEVLANVKLPPRSISFLIEFLLFLFCKVARPVNIGESRHKNMHSPFLLTGNQILTRRLESGKPEIVSTTSDYRGLSPVANFLNAGETLTICRPKAAHRR